MLASTIEDTAEKPTDCKHGKSSSYLCMYTQLGTGNECFPRPLKDSRLHQAQTGKRTVGRLPDDVDLRVGSAASAAFGSALATGSYHSMAFG